MILEIIILPFFTMKYQGYFRFKYTFYELFNLTL